MVAAYSSGVPHSRSKHGKHALLTAVLQQSYELSTLIHKVVHFAPSTDQQSQILTDMPLSSHRTGLGRIWIVRMT